MTEVERIISSGLVSPDFLKEEVIDGCLVSENTKKLWVVLLDLLKEVDRICKKHNLKYFLGAGTLIGAVRHKGFIPWDDDIDLFMLRDDYEKLLEIGETEFKYPYFMQTPYTDKGTFFSFLRIRNSNTTMIDRAFKYEKFNQGCVLDIFPLDNCVLEGSLERYNIIKELIIENATYMRLNNPFPSDNEMERKKKYLSKKRNQLEVNERIHSIASQFNNINTEHVILGTNTIVPFGTGTFPKSAFDKSIVVDFYGIKATIPAGYDEVLTIAYGDYMQMPPESERYLRSNFFIDMDIPYKEYWDIENWDSIFPC